MLIPATSRDDDAPICGCPHHRAGDLRLAGERPEAIPDRRLERVAELVATGPTFGVDDPVSVNAAEHDPVDATTPAGAAAKGDDSHNVASPLELLPHRLA